VIRVDGPRHVWVPEVVALMRAQGRPERDVEHFRRVALRQTTRGPRCTCPWDGMPPLNACPRHEAVAYADFAARHRGSERAVQLRASYDVVGQILNEISQ
jgi:hypothetical protein